MMISGMTGIAGASEISASGSTQQVSTEAEAASAEGSGSSEKEKESGKPAEGDSKKNSETEAGTEEKKTESDKTEEEKSEKEKSEEADSENKEENSSDKEENSADTEESSENKEDESKSEASEESGTDADANEAESSASDSASGMTSDSGSQETADDQDQRQEENQAADTGTGTDTQDGKAAINGSVISAEQEEQAVTTEPVGNMLPIKEEKAYLIIDSEDIDPSKVPLKTVFDELMYGDGSKVKIDPNRKAVWAYVKDADGKVIHDEYHEIKEGTTLDLSSISPSKTTYTFEMIVGNGVQLDYDATRYIVRVFIGSYQQDFVKFPLYKTDKNGKRSKVEPKDVVVQGFTGFGESGTMRTYILSEMEEGDQYYVGIESLLDEHPLLNFRAFGLEDFINMSATGQISPGMAEIARGKAGIVNSDMTNPENGFPVKVGTEQAITIPNTLMIYYIDVYPDTGKEEVQTESLKLYHFRVVTDAQSFEDEAFTVADNEMVNVKYSTSSTMLLDDFDVSQNISYWKGFENVTANQVILKKGYPADAEYYYALDAHSLIWEDANEHVVAAYNDWYHTLEEARENGLRDIKDELLPKDSERNGIYGYKANYDRDKGGQGFTVFFDDGTSFRFAIYFEELDPSMEYLMKDYDTAPVIGSQDPWFHMTGLKLDGRELDTYIVENGKSINMDTYYGYGYQTVMVNEVLTEDEIARLVPIFEVGDPDRVEIRLPGSDKELVSGQSQVDFSGKSKSAKDDDIANMVAIIDGHTKNYQVRVISKMSGPKLYVYDDYTDQGGDRFREILLNDYFEEKHDILIANVGDAPLTGLKVRLELDENANHVKLDD